MISSMSSLPGRRLARTRAPGGLARPPTDLADREYRDRLRRPDPHEIISAQLQTSPHFVVCTIPKEYADAELLKKLRDRNKLITFVVLSGTQPEKIQHCIDAGARWLKPELSAAMIAEWNTLQRDWNAIVAL